VRQVESVGVDFMSVHGRLKSQRSSTPPNLDAIALVKSTVQCPVVANGDVYSLKDVKAIVSKTNVDGAPPFPRFVTEIRCNGGAWDVGESGIVCWT
jgi:tRNA-dihydrouridine synthase